VAGLHWPDVCVTRNGNKVFRRQDAPSKSISVAASTAASTGSDGAIARRAADTCSGGAVSVIVR